MLKVYKYEVPFVDKFTLDLPMGAQCLSFQEQHGKATLWALVDPTAALIGRHFRLAGTGHQIEHDGRDLRFIGTAQFHGGALVFHLFETLR